MSKYRTVGTERRDELNPGRFRHDMRRTSQKAADALSSPTAALVLFMVLAVFGFVIPALCDLLFFIGVGLFFFIKSAHKKYMLPVKMPQHSERIDPQELHPGTGKPILAKGSFYLGNDKITKEEIWLTNRDAGVHMLVLGTTGSGKTELLLGICQNSLNQGSGFMFVDGKAQDKIAFKIMDLVRARGRDDDFLCLNFMTGAKDIIGPQPGKITNTMNPFSYGSSGMVSQIVVGLMASGGGGDDMWKDRAISFVEALSPPLTYLRDNYNVMLDVNEFRNYFEIEKIEELAWKGGEKYPGLDQVLDAAKNYLLNLPGYDRLKVGKRGGQGDDTKLQHGFITMQLVRAFTSLADTYSHIVRVPLGEVYFPDLVKNRRILVVMLPSLEKTPSETANIGKIIVTALRNIMAEGLGAVLEGDRFDLENEEGRAMLPPYVVILDEYGYYAVKGFAVAFAQARSLGFVCVVGGQDLASFQRESKEEAVSICGNTRIKLFGSIEDPEQTMNFVVQTAGKSQVAKSANFEAEAGALATSYSDNMAVHFDTIDRISPSDVKEQVEGEFHVVWRSRVIRAQTYFVDPKKISKVRLNHFISVPPPTKEQLDSIEMTTSGLVQRMSTMDLSGGVDIQHNAAIEAATGMMENAKMANLTTVESSICSVIGVSKAAERYAREFRENLRMGGSGNAALDELRGGRRTSYGDGDDDDDGPLQMPDFGIQSDVDENGSSDVGSSSGSEYVRSESDESSMTADVVRPDNSMPFQSMTVFSFPDAKSNTFGSEVFSGESEMERRTQTALTNAEPMLDYNKTYQGVESIELQMGATPEQAGAAARQVIQGIEDVTRYPQSVPKEKQSQQVSDLLSDLINGLTDGDD